MLRCVAACPTARALADLKDCLDFCSTSWIALFCRLGGPALLLQAGRFPPALVPACMPHSPYR